MSAVEERLNKLREERIAREKARIEKLRELNLKKYSKTESEPLLKQSTTSLNNKNVKPTVKNIPKPAVKKEPVKNATGPVKNNFHVNNTTKRPISAPIKRNNADIKPKIPVPMPTKAANAASNNKNSVTIDKKSINKLDVKLNNNKSFSHVLAERKDLIIKPMDTKKIVKKDNSNDASSIPKRQVINAARNDPRVRKSLAPFSAPKQQINNRKSMIPTLPSTKESVFDRLYQNKPNKVVKKPEPEVARNNIRRSISAVHFKRINKRELSNCIIKWSSIGDNLNKLNLKEISEDALVRDDKIVSAVKSERKKVKFQTPVPFNYNTPRPEELQSRLKSWLQKRGKSLDSYHHLQCFGIHHLPRKLQPLHLENQFDDENKENVPVISDSDDESFTDLTVNGNNGGDGDGDGNGDCIAIVEDTKWRAASFVSDSVDLNESQNTTINSEEPQVDELMLGALEDLTQLLKDGFSWEQGARWLRAVRERCPSATNTAAYWEARAALEERRGDLPASLQCWEEAVAQGSERSVAEANVEQLLDKFMQLKISPNSVKKQRQPDSKLVDVRNVFRSTIIRFAVQRAKLRKSTSEVRYTVTPVRRSGRLSCGPQGRPPCSLLPHAQVHPATPGDAPPALFVRNRLLRDTP